MADDDTVQELTTTCQGGPEYATLCTRGIICDAPPCAICLERNANSCCNDCCHSFGQIGIRSLSSQKYRAPVMSIFGYMAVAQLPLMIWACIGGLSTKGSDIKNSSWAYTDVSSYGTVWAGLAGVHTEIEFTDDNGDKYSFTETHKWSEACDDFNDQGFDYDQEKKDNCDSCASLATGMQTSTIGGILGRVGQLTTDFTRSRKDMDVNCQKVFGVVTGIFTSFMTLSSLSGFTDACITSMPGSFMGPNGDTISLSSTWGPGNIITALISFWAICDGILHLLVPVPEDGAEPGYIDRRPVSPVSPWCCMNCCPDTWRNCWLNPDRSIMRDKAEEDTTAAV